MDFGQLLNLALTIVSIATLAGLGLLRGTVTNLREQLRDERDLTASLRQRHVEEAAAAAQRSTEDRAQIAQLQTDLAALGRVVTGEAHWTAIGHQLDEHHQQASEWWATQHELLRQLVRAEGVCHD